MTEKKKELFQKNKETFPQKYFFLGKITSKTQKLEPEKKSLNEPLKNYKYGMVIITLQKTKIEWIFFSFVKLL